MGGMWGCAGFRRRGGRGGSSVGRGGGTGGWLYLRGCGGRGVVRRVDYGRVRWGEVSGGVVDRGGIGNLTGIPGGAGVDGVMAFDTGAGNMVIDASMRRLYEREFDKGGVVAGTGSVLKDV